MYITASCQNAIFVPLTIANTAKSLLKILTFELKIDLDLLFDKLAYYAERLIF